MNETEQYKKKQIQVHMLPQHIYTAVTAYLLRCARREMRRIPFACFLPSLFSSLSIHFETYKEEHLSGVLVARLDASTQRSCHLSSNNSFPDLPAILHYELSWRPLHTKNELRKTYLYFQKKEKSAPENFLPFFFPCSFIVRDRRRSLQPLWLLRDFNIQAIQPIKGCSPF